MAIISKRGIFGIKWIYLIIGIAAYFFRQQIMGYVQPLLDKLKKSTPAKEVVNTQTETTNV